MSKQSRKTPKEIADLIRERGEKIIVDGKEVFAINCDANVELERMSNTCSRLDLAKELGGTLYYIMDNECTILEIKSNGNYWKGPYILPKPVQNQEAVIDLRDRIKNAKSNRGYKELFG